MCVCVRTGFSSALVSLRIKIETLVRKGGVPDQDCPEDPESMRYWSSTGAVSKESAKEKQKGMMIARVKSTGDLASSLIGTSAASSDVSTMAAPGTEQALALATTLRENTGKSNQTH